MTQTNSDNNSEGSEDMTKQANHLIHEKSPYLLQHAYNPVNWYPWNDEAFTKAKEEDKPIFLSIGYSTCHWCHVMEHESFEDEDVATYLNEHFISIKVDREERPDIDTVYMSICQALTGQGGWPLTIFMTPTQQAFYAGTYFPKTSRYGRPGFLDVLKTIDFNWNHHRAKVTDITKQIESHFKDLEGIETEGDSLSMAIIQNGVNQLKQSYDPRFGGFGTAPKFPTPHKLMFLLRYDEQTKDKSVQDMVTQTLDHMYKGGIFDHLGYGFSRYSTDEIWLVPHFEKMLYDNALLMISYTEAYQVTREPRYLSIAMQTAEYVLTQLTSPEGGFYCAEDADSEGEEGKFYVFTPAEIIQILGPEKGHWFNEFYNVTEEGNFEGKNILNRLHHKKLELDIKELEACRETLLTYRLERTPLQKDDKILTSWNGLMIAAFAKLYGQTQKMIYLDAASKAVTFIKQHLFDETRLLARYREGESHFKAYLDDYAFLSYGLIELHQSTAEVEYLELAIQLNKEMLDLFKDEAGGFYLTGHDAETLMLRPKELYDGAMPSGNSVAAYNLIRLAKLTGDTLFETEAEKQIQYLAKQVKHYEMNHTFYLIAALFALSDTKELMITVPKQEQIKEILKQLNETPHFNTTLLFKTPENQTQLSKLAPYTKDYPIVDQPTYYLCSNGTCQAPTSSLESLKNIL